MQYELAIKAQVTSNPKDIQTYILRFQQFTSSIERYIVLYVLLAIRSKKVISIHANFNLEKYKKIALNSKL
jgi:hypothetical protein